ncbi:MAG: hypothetical protein IPP90_07170 [Gemmatimonadaceae bacterium]|nr:hypothetical protein [Gemmatimonadaceae bacterium]
MLTRRAVLASLVSVLVPATLRARGSLVVPSAIHPTPRRGITGAKVLTAAQLASSPDLIELFDGIRAIPQIADGIGCHCGCADFNGHRSLLTCYEADAMAKSCPICQGEGRVAVRMAKARKSLNEIRIAIDAQYG